MREIGREKEGHGGGSPYGSVFFSFQIYHHFDIRITRCRNSYLVIPDTAVDNVLYTSQVSAVPDALSVGFRDTAPTIMYSNIRHRWCPNQGFNEDLNGNGTCTPFHPNLDKLQWCIYATTSKLGWMALVRAHVRHYIQTLTNRNNGTFISLHLNFDKWQKYVYAITSELRNDNGT